MAFVGERPDGATGATALSLYQKRLRGPHRGEIASHPLLANAWSDSGC